MTKQRELILQILNQADRHLTADEIFFLAKLKMPGIAMATVYNNLNAMNDLGLINRVHVDGGADCFERDVDRHDHAICDGCGKLTNLHLADFSTQLRNTLGSEINSYNLTVHYLCPECRKKH